ncbi:DrmB family protein [Micromonosporaceae bacterium DT194]|uniref:DrmB family protein n=1 Tax=Melissospora conviva TaxID=3388432 RepID=UPI003C270DC2
MRRAQLVTPFGVGAMSVLVNGTSVITAGLDHWFDVDDSASLQLDEYEVTDWRLEARLRVSGFRLPPDFRRPQGDSDLRNTNLKVPVLRFPRWSFCMYCKRLELSPLTMAQPVECADPRHDSPDSKGKKRRKRPRMSQVPFVVICANGHLDDFPFREWVHRNLNPNCRGVLRLESRGAGGLDGQVVRCDAENGSKGCGASRSLENIMNAYWGKNHEEHTHLTDNLVGKELPYYCKGTRPWLAEKGGICDEPVRGALRGAGNVYFPKVESSIYLPRKVGAVSAELHALLNRGDVRPTLKFILREKGRAASADDIRKYLPIELFRPISDDELLAGYRDLFGIDSDSANSDRIAADSEPETDDAETLTGNDEWRYPEFRLLRETPADDYLTASDPGLPSGFQGLFDRVRSVEVLRETRALRGFTRVRDDVLKLSAGKAMLQRRRPGPEQEWLPAYVVKGEGIYIELSGKRLDEWEQRREVLERVQRITDHYGVIARTRGIGARVITPRFVLLHTLGHLLINELVFACGYSSASLRERLYASDVSEYRMAGLLIYTAAGDSEGTMGGLVRMARPENLRSVVLNAIGDARWCSTDPVCMDSGEGGQGPDSCNLAACHGCALLPETSCEEFNRFLDRGLVVGTFEAPDLGFFSGRF